jgi:hypothetical protein
MSAQQKEKKTQTKSSYAVKVNNQSKAAFRTKVILYQMNTPCSER